MREMYRKTMMWLGREPVVISCYAAVGNRDDMMFQFKFEIRWWANDEDLQVAKARAASVALEALYDLTGERYHLSGPTEIVPCE